MLFNLEMFLHKNLDEPGFVEAIRGYLALSDLNCFHGAYAREGPLHSGTAYQQVLQGQGVLQRVVLERLVGDVRIGCQTNFSVVRIRAEGAVEDLRQGLVPYLSLS